MSQVRQPVDLAVITEAKKLTTLVFSITDKSPKKFRFTFVSRLQNLTLDIVESLFRAYDTNFDLFRSFSLATNGCGTKLA